MLWVAGASFAVLYFAVAAYVCALLMVPGYVLSSLIFRDSSCPFRIAASTAVSAPIYSIVVLVAVAAGQYRDWISSIFAALMIGGSLLALSRRPALMKDFRAADKTHLKWTLILFVFAISLMALPASLQDIPYTAGHSLQETRMPILPGDQYLPYRLEQILLNGADWKQVNFYGIWTVADRTPMMGLVAAFVTSSIHVIPPLDWIWNVPGGAFSWNVFQIVGIWLDAQIIITAYLVLKELFGPAKARLAMPFLALSPFIVWNTFYTSPKSMAAYFILLSVLLIVQKKTVRAGVMAGLGFLSHSFTLFYVLGALYLIFRKAWTNIRRGLSNISFFLASAGLVVAPWLVWSSLVYGHTSSFILYPFASSGPDSTLGAAQVMERFLRAPPMLSIWVRVVNAFRTLLPWPLMITPGWFAQYGWADLFSWSPSVDVLLLYTYFFTIPGAVSLTLTFPAYLAWIRSRNEVILATVTLPLISAIFFFGYPWAGFSVLMAQPLVPLLVGVGVASLRTSRLTFVVLLGVIVEFFFVIWLHVYPAGLLLTNIRSASDAVFLAAVAIWAMLVAKMTLNSFQIEYKKNVRPAIHGGAN